MILSRFKNIKVSSFIVLLLLTFMAIHMISSFAFVHYHVLSNGEVIYHSHFAKEDNSPANNSKGEPFTNHHNHSKKEYLHLYLSTVIEKLLIFAVVLSLSVILATPFFVSFIQHLSPQEIVQSLSTRAPPFSIL